MRPECLKAPFRFANRQVLWKEGILHVPGHLLEYPDLEMDVLRQADRCSAPH